MSGLVGTWLTSMKPIHTHIQGQRGREGILHQDFCLTLSPQLLLSSSLFNCSPSLYHSPSFTLFFHPLHPNYWCHCKLNCCKWIAAFPLNSPDCYLVWWKWRLFPSANFKVCVMGGTEENAGWLPSLLWNVFTKGCEQLWSLDSRPCISNILLFCLSLWVLCKHFSPHFLFFFSLCCFSELKLCSQFYSFSQHPTSWCWGIFCIFLLDTIDWSWTPNSKKINSNKLKLVIV